MPFRQRSALLAACIASLAAAACAAPSVASFDWRDGSGARLSFRQAASMEKGREGDFGPGRSENRYLLAKPYRIAAGRSLEIVMDAAFDGGKAPGSPAPAIVFSAGPAGRGAKPFAEARFPLLETSTRFFVRLPPGQELSWLSVAFEPGATASTKARIVSIDDAPSFRGYLLDGDGLRVSDGFSLAMKGGETLLALDSPFETLPDAAAGRSPKREALLLECEGLAAGSKLTLSSDRPAGGSEELAIRARSARQRILLAREAFPEEARAISLRLPAGARATAFCATAADAKELEPADLGTILRSRPAAPGADYDLYRWDLLPGVLVFDFRDYSAQDRYLKRLAFFVEKAGYRGTLQRDEVIGPLHGWNAHDYRPEDLAAFFRKARETGFPLGEEERSLERLLLERGLIRAKGGRIEAGEGALISIARESPSYLRRTFVVHESTHALFFADAEYRAYVTKAWSTMETGEKWFWTRYFQWMVYDTGSPYLMANEYQAYLMQQPVAKARDYFTKTLPANLLCPEVLARDPGLKQRVEEYMAKYGDRFERRAAELEAWLSAAYGFSAGRTYFVD